MLQSLSSAFLGGYAFPLCAYLLKALLTLFRHVEKHELVVEARLVEHHVEQRVDKLFGFLFVCYQAALHKLALRYRQLADIVALAGVQYLAQRCRGSPQPLDVRRFRIELFRAGIRNFALYQLS